MKNFLALLSISAFLLPVFSVLVVSAQPKVKSFAEWCQQKNAVSAATKHTIDVLLTKAGTKNCQLADRQLRRLTKLSLSNNKITDLKPLAGLNNLIELSIDNNQISDLQPLSGLSNLTTLVLYRNQIVDVKPLAGLIKLNYLNVSGNKISNVEPLADLINLTKLWLPFNQIIDVEPLANLRNLNQLSLSDNKIKNVQPFAGLLNLTVLDIAHNQIVDVRPFVSLNNLTELALDHNQIVNVDSLAGLTKLTYLSLESNQISNVKQLAGLTKLKTLTLDKNLVNPITSVTTQLPNNNELSDEGLTTKSVGDERNFTSISQLKDMKPSDSYYQAVQSLTERYGVMYAYNDRKFHAERRLTRGQLISFLNSSLDRVNEIMAAASANSRVPVKFGYCGDKSLAINEIFRVDCSLYKNSVTSISQIKDVKLTDTYFVNLQSLTERYNIKLIDPDNYFRSSKPVTKKEFYDLMNLIFNYRPVGSPLVSEEPLTRGEFITFFNEMLDRTVERIGVATSRSLK